MPLPQMKPCCLPEMPQNLLGWWSTTKPDPTSAKTSNGQQSQGSMNFERGGGGAVPQEEVPQARKNTLPGGILLAWATQAVSRDDSLFVRATRCAMALRATKPDRSGSKCHTPCLFIWGLALPHSNLGPQLACEVMDLWRIYSPQVQITIPTISILWILWRCDGRGNVPRPNF